VKSGCYPEEFFTLSIEIISTRSGSYISADGILKDLFSGTVKLTRGVLYTGAVFKIMIVKISDVLDTRSGRVPVIFI
jgi:hypothetical protein